MATPSGLRSRDGQWASRRLTLDAAGCQRYETIGVAFLKLEWARKRVFRVYGSGTESRKRKRSVKESDQCERCKGETPMPRRVSASTFVDPLFHFFPSNLSRARCLIYRYLTPVADRRTTWKMISKCTKPCHPRSPVLHSRISNGEMGGRSSRSRINQSRKLMGICWSQVRILR